MNLEMPQCPECEVELDFDDTIDEWCNGDVIELKEVGHCPKCGKEYKWKDVYNWHHFEDLEEY